jgi:hypothetical protein
LKIKTSWWIDGSFGLEVKIGLRKKLAGFPQVTIENSEGEFVTAAIPERDLSLIVAESIHEIAPGENSWVWISFHGDRTEENQGKLSEMIAGKTNVAVYSFIHDGRDTISPTLYREMKKKILTKQIPIFCLCGSSNLHDSTPKVILDFLRATYNKKILLNTDNPRYGYIIKKELVDDRKLQNLLRITIDSDQGQVALGISAKTGDALDRAVSLVMKKAKAFKLDAIAQEK